MKKQQNRPLKFLPQRKRILLGIFCLVLAGAALLPSVHFFFQRGFGKYYCEDGIGTKTEQLAARHIALWTEPDFSRSEVAKMRSSCAEWDLMARTFCVLALTNMSLREPGRKDEYLDAVDKIIDQTMVLEKEKGIYYFLMDYAKNKSFINEPARSLFIDGEIALMLAARQMVEVRQDYRPLLAERVDIIIDYMRKGEVLSAESYPDECWTFCNSVALAAITISDILDGRDHSDFCQRWVEMAKKRLIDSRTGILFSSYSLDGRPIDGPEGSTIWMACHCLQIVDVDFAQDQYNRAKRELAGDILGFGFAREWPPSWRGPLDIDSGPVIPVIQASPSSSGLAFVAASSFGDETFLKELFASLRLGAFEKKQNGKIGFYACNQIGEAVLLYSMALGPMWQKVKDAQSAAKKEVGE
ncbi:MAG: hypothetical protein JW715_01455 [Sedimentisphaerales bacterium]|nr:hypothetical protein [Sedimentisphaerales bacterium]